MGYKKCLLIYRWLCHINQNTGRKRTDHPKSENVRVETEIKEKVKRVTKIERVEIVINKGRILKLKKIFSLNTKK